MKVIIPPDGIKYNVLYPDSSKKFDSFILQGWNDPNHNYNVMLFNTFGERLSILKEMETEVVYNIETLYKPTYHSDGTQSISILDKNGKELIKAENIEHIDYTKYVGMSEGIGYFNKGYIVDYEDKVCLYNLDGTPDKYYGQINKKQGQNSSYTIVMKGDDLYCVMEFYGKSTMSKYSQLKKLSYYTIDNELIWEGVELQY